MTQFFTYRGFGLASAPPSIRLLLTLFLVLVTVGMAVGMVNYQVRTGLTAEGSAAWYRGRPPAVPAGVAAEPFTGDAGESEGRNADGRQAASAGDPGTLAAREGALYEKSPLELLDATHPHLFNQAFLFFVLGHLLALCAVRPGLRMAVYLGGFGGVLIDTGAPWLIRYGDPGFAWLQLAGHLVMGLSFLALVGFPLREMWGRRAWTALGLLVAVLAWLAWWAVPASAKVPAGAPVPAIMDADVVSAPAPDTTPRVRMDRGWPVMGTLFRVTVLAPDSARARRALEAARAEVFDVDARMSTYRPDSELSRLNDAAGTGRWTVLSAGTGRVLEAALGWARRTEGAFDPTVGPLADVWGFHEGRPARPSEARRDSAARLVDWRRVELERGAKPPSGPAAAPEGEGRPDGPPTPPAGSVRARLERSGMRLDFGGIAKGYALDRAVAAMRRAGATAGMVDLGGNVSVFGPPPPGGEGWRIGIRHPREEGGLLGTMLVEEGSLATSGDTEQFFELDGRRYSHIMDPRTGRPARGVAQVTVHARNGMTADALSTVLFVMGPGPGVALMESPAVREEAPDATVVWVLDPDGNPADGRRVVVHGPGRVRLGEPDAPPAKPPGDPDEG